MRAKRWRYAGKTADPFYRTSVWRNAREAVLRRDMYRCQICKRRWANVVHHIIPRKERPDLALDMDNLQSVCEICHNQEHPEKGRRRTTAETAVKGVRVVKL